MSLFNKTENFSIFPTRLVYYEPVINFLLANLPKYVMSMGIVGNLISLLVFSRPCLNQKTNSGRLYTILCCLSLILIVYNMAGRKLDSTFEFKIRLSLDTHVFINIILLQYWSWIQLLITFDRFIGVFYPVKGVRIIGKKCVLYSIIFGMLVFIIAINSPFYITCSTYIVGNETYRGTGIQCDEVVILTEIVKILMEFVIPYLFMVIVDLMVIIRLRKSKTGLGERQPASRNSKSLRFSRNTVLIDFIYLIFNFPPIIFNLYSIFLFINPDVNFFDTFIYVIPMFNNIFPYIYPSILFLVFVTFNRIFRSEFLSTVINCFNSIKNRLF